LFNHRQGEGPEDDRRFARAEAALRWSRVVLEL